MTASRRISDLPGPRGLPLVGNAHQLSSIEHVHSKIEEWRDLYGPIFRVKVGLRSMVAIGDEQAINEILRDRPQGYERDSHQNAVIQAMRRPGPARKGPKWGLFAVEGEEWEKQRRFVLGVLNANRVPRYFEIVQEAAGDLRRRLLDAAADGEPVEIFDLLTGFTIDATVALALGQNPKTLEGGDGELPRHLRRVLAMMVRRVGLPVAYWRWFRLPADRALDRSLGRIYEEMEAALARTRERLEAEPALYAEAGNVLEGLLAAQREDASHDDEEILFNLLSILIGGEDTTASSLGWAVYLLATHPEVQQRLAGEADEALGDAPVAAEYATLEHLPYAEAVLRESMRLKSVFPVLPIEPTEDKTICETHVPAGTQLMLLLRHAGRIAAGRSDEFLPERWLEQNEETKPRRSLSFGAGPRFCPGRNFAFLEAKTALSMLARNFELELDDSAGPVVEECVPAMAPHGLRVRIAQRQPTALAAQA